MAEVPGFALPLSNEELTYLERTDSPRLEERIQLWMPVAALMQLSHKVEM
jgi:hypothetical protein